MKFKKQQLVQIIREELGQITNEAGKYAEDSYKDVDTSETIHDAAFDSLVLGHGIGTDLRDRLGRIDRDSAEELQAIYVGLMKAAHSAREFIEQSAGALQEVSPIEERERDRARKSTGQYQDMRIKAKEMLWAYFDEELGAMDARASKRIGNKPSDNLVDKIFNLMVDSVPAEVPDNVKRARKDAEEKRKFADIEKMGIHNLENPNIAVRTHKSLKPQPRKKQSLGQRLAWGGLEENTMKMTTASLRQMIKEELNLGMDQEGEGGAPEENVALDNLTAAVDSLIQNLGYTIEEVLEIVQGLGESSGVSVAMDGDQEVSMRDIAEDQELEECGYPEEEEEEPKRYFEI